MTFLRKGCAGLATFAASTLPLISIGIACGFASSAAQAQKPPQIEIQVTANEIIDNEYDQDHHQFTFTDRDYNLWIGYYDGTTGAFYPPDGHGLLVDTNSAFSTDFGNGPEWAYSQAGPQIVYTKYAPNSQHSTATAGVAVASEINGTWSGAIIPNGGKRHSPIATLDRNDPVAEINYQNVSNTLVDWRNINASTEQAVLDSAGDDGSRRFVGCSTCPAVNQMHAIIFTGAPPGGGTHQVFLYHTDTNTVEQLTFDNTSKSGGFMWQAPEFNNDYVFFTTIARTQIAIYRQMTQPDGSKAWTVITSAKSITSLPYMWSPEPFIYNNRSYVFMQIGSSQANDFSHPTQIAMMDINPGNANFRLLTDDNTVKRVRMDPEIVILTGGPSIYYNRYIPSTSTHKQQQDGVWRVDTGITPATTASLNR